MKIAIRWAVLGLLALSAARGENTPATGGDLAGKKIAFLGDSITQAGGYIAFTEYFWRQANPGQALDIYPLGLSSETLSGLCEKTHPWPRPCLFERLGRLLEKVHPQVVFACYGMNDGIYQPLDESRFAAFRDGVNKLIAACQAAGVEKIYLVTPPIFETPPGAMDYDAILTAYSQWEMSLKIPGVTLIDLHSAMRRARDAQDTNFTKDHIHPGDAGHLVMARSLLTGLGIKAPERTLESIKADPLYALIQKKRALRATGWMNHIGYTRNTTVIPQELGDTESKVAELVKQIEALRPS